MSNSPVVNDEAKLGGNGTHLYSFAGFQLAAPIQAQSEGPRPLARNLYTLAILMIIDLISRRNFT